MPGIAPPNPVSPDDLKATTDRVSALETSVPQYISGGQFITRDKLLTDYTASASVLGRLARVSDMWGTVSTTAICEYDQLLGYYWRPQRTDYAGNITQTAGTVSLMPLVTPPVIYFPNSPTANMTVTPSTTNVWPGAAFHIYTPSTIPALVSINMSGLVGGGVLPLLQNSDRVIVYTPQGWKGV